MFIKKEKAVVLVARCSAALVVVATLLLSCGGGEGSAGTPSTTNPPTACLMSSAAPVAETSGTRVLLQVKPSAASSCITTIDEPSQAYRDPAVPQKGLLAVFLPGTGGFPAQFPAFVQRGAARGYHSIGLAYNNGTSVNATCNGPITDADCAGAVREETFSGRETSALVSVSREDSIEGRLIALLKYLSFHRPGDGWSQYLDAQGSVLWDKVSLSGNSQGAGHAGYISKVRRVYRVGLYAGPSDWVLVTNVPANWYGLSSQTPAAAIFGLVHVPDTLANASGDLNQVTSVWGAVDKFNMTGPITNVANGTPPYGGSHRLTTTACVSLDATNQHNCPMFRGNEVVWDVVSFP